MELVICEKSSMAKSIAVALGVSASGANGFFMGKSHIITWCVGHLVGLANAAQYDERYKKWRYEDLPILPDPFLYTTIPDKKKVLETIRSLMHRADVDTIVNACDAGREGELIFRLVYEMCDCQKPVKRLWVSSLEEKAVREGFENLRPGSEYEPLYQAALCRQKADWLVGINASRLFSVLYHHTLNIGRVQTPTLAMLVERERKISQFQKEPYYHVRLKLGDADAVSEKFSDREMAKNIQQDCENQPVTCTSVVREQKSEKPPKLYDLTTLQREANRIYGYTARQTLEYAQSLYEKKLLTYPRTDSRYLTDHMTETVSAVIHMAAELPPFQGCTAFTPAISPLISDKDVSDHHALLPTIQTESTDMSDLPLGERNVLLLVCSKLLCASAEPHIYETVTAVFDCAGHSFTAKGKRVVSEGWRGIERSFRESLKSKPEEPEDLPCLPDFTEGQQYQNIPSTITEHFTTPPKPYTEDTLLSAMENAGKDEIPDDAERKGLGTPATRAGIIEKLIADGLAVRKGKSLLPTENGFHLVAILPEMLTSPLLTAQWEQQLTTMARGETAAEDFMDGIEAMIRDLVGTYSQVSEDGKKLFEPDQEPVGSCPRCGRPVYESKNNFACSDRGCQFVIWKNDRFWVSRRKELTKKIVAGLLKNGRASVKGMWSEKRNDTYDGTVLLDDTGGRSGNHLYHVQHCPSAGLHGSFAVRVRCGGAT